MITLLAKHLIPNHQNTTSPTVRQAYGALCSTLGILFNLLLFGGKYLAGHLAGSIAITADAFNNLSDAASSIITLLGIRWGDKQPDTNHPFGHGRIEYLSGVAVSILIIVVGLELGQDSVVRIKNPQPLTPDWMTLAILAASILVKLYMFLYNRKFGRKINSPGMMATAMDSLSDVVTTLAVLLGMVIYSVTGIHADGWCGILVSTFILYSGIKSTFETLSPLLGNPPEAEFVAQIESIVLSYDEIVNIHDLVVHDYGPGRRMISLHAEVPGDGDLFVLHDAVDSAELELQEKLGCRAIIHMDPISVNDEKVNSLKAQISQYASELHSGISIHDFRIVDGPTHTNVIFEAMLPYEAKITPQQLHTILCAYVRSTWPRHNPIVTIDRPYQG